MVADAAVTRTTNNRESQRHAMGMKQWVPGARFAFAIASILLIGCGEVGETTAPVASEVKSSETGAASTDEVRSDTHEDRATVTDDLASDVAEGEVSDQVARYIEDYAAMSHSKIEIPTPEQALPGREEEMPVVEKHYVTGQPIKGDFPGTERILVGMGCFWGAERLFWKTPGVITTAVGYAGGHTPNPTYEEVCSGLTGHTEVVLVVFDPQQIACEALLQIFWESHDPTQGMRQQNDVGTQYRSAIYCYSSEQRELAERTRAQYQQALDAAGHGEITTEISDAPPFYYAEPYHQQYLGKKPWGYCGLAGTGVACPTGLGTQ